MHKIEAKVTKSYHLLRNYPITWLFITAIWILCLIPIPETPLNHVDFIDKWTHIALYALLCTVIKAEYLRSGHRYKKNKVLLGTLIAPLLMGGLIEIVQATCTYGLRSGEWLDFAADAVGCMAGWLIGMALEAFLSIRHRGTEVGENCKTDDHL